MPPRSAARATVDTAVVPVPFAVLYSVLFSVVVMLVGGCGVSSAPPGDAVTTGPATTGPATTGPVGTDPPDGSGTRAPEGFGSVIAVITPAGDPGDDTGRDAGRDRLGICEVCVWLADDGDRRARGLMRVDDLDGRAGMAFVYDSPRTTNFTMRNTLLPLSIAFFDADGAFIDAFDMDPCAGEPCPSYPTPSGFLVALEVPRGDLEQLRVGPGARLEIVTDAPCP